MFWQVVGYVLLAWFGIMGLFLLVYGALWTWAYPTWDRLSRHFERRANRRRGHYPDKEWYR
jgi:hypothetical protein